MSPADSAVEPRTPTQRLLDDALAVRGDSAFRGSALCAAYTESVDRWIQALFTEAVAHAASGSRTSGTDGVALVAVGGHGRGELCPQSDLDLLLVCSDTALVESIAERLWYPMWDARFRVGHGARSVGETLDLAGEDLETATALITTRHLAGDVGLTDSLVEATEAQRRKKSRAWTKRLLTAFDARRSSAGEVAHELEPDLKEGAGGLRDRHFLDWMTALGAPTSEVDPAALMNSYDRLLAVRVELHRVTGRPGDRLALQEQDAVASALDLGDGVELMRTVSRAARELAFAAEGLARRAAPRRARLGRNSERVLRDDPDLGATVVLAPTEVRLIPGGESDPRASLRLAVVAAERGLPMSTESVDRLADSPEMTNPWSPTARRMLVRLLMSGTGCIDVIEALDRSGAWSRLIPEWSGVSCKPQRNPYHRWNVDRHLTETVAKAATLVGRVSRPDLLMMGALLHDIGKNDASVGLDHSEAGAAMAAEIAPRMGFDAAESETIAALVADHLLLPDVATRRDLDDPATIGSVARRVGTASRLHLLAALSEADGKATGVSAWTPWKADLVRDLVRKVEATLTDSVDDPVLKTKAFPSEALRARAAAHETGLDATDDVLTVIWPDHVGLFARISGVLALNGFEVLAADVGSENGMAIDQIRVRTLTGDAPDWERAVQQLEAAFAGRLALRARVAARATSYRNRRLPGAVTEPTVTFEAASDATIIEVAAPDSVGLLYRLTSTLSEMRLDIRRAAVATIGPDAVDTFYVVTSEGAPVTDPDYQKEIRVALAFAASNP